MGGSDTEKKAKLAERGEEGGSPSASPELVESMGKLQDIQDELEAVRIMLSFLIFVCEFIIDSGIIVL